jgi:hypothetical protein
MTNADADAAESQQQRAQHAASTFQFQRAHELRDIGGIRSRKTVFFSTLRRQADLSPGAALSLARCSLKGRDERARPECRRPGLPQRRGGRSARRSTALRLKRPS